MSSASALQTPTLHPLAESCSGAAGEPGKLAVQPREVKFSTVVASGESRFCEANSSRRGGKVPTKLHALTARSAKRTSSSDLEKVAADDASAKPSSSGKSEASAASGVHAATQEHVSAPGAQGLFIVPSGKGAMAGAFAVQHTSDNTTGVGLSESGARQRRRRNEPNSREPRRGLVSSTTGPPRWLKQGKDRGSTLRALAPLPATPSDAQKGHSLHIEGNSFFPVEQSPHGASAALLRLSEAVSQERRLREQLEDTRRAKLSAFRSVIKIFLQSWQPVPRRELAVTGGEKGPSPSAAAFPDALAMAKCSVVTNTLVTTIQTYMRAKQTGQLVTALASIHGVLGDSSLMNMDNHVALSLRSDAQSRRQASAAVRDTIPSTSASFFDGSMTDASVEDVLDTSEVARLRQLYFDYFDCEAVPLPQLEEANARANGFAPPSGFPFHTDLLASTNPSSVFSATFTSSCDAAERGPDAEACLSSQRSL